jgi:hypothetical protein
VPARYGGPVVVNAGGAEWLDCYLPIDPLLREPLSLYGSEARRRTQAEALLRVLGFEHRLAECRISDSTLRLAFDMLPRLVDTLDRRRCEMAPRARAVVVGVRTLDNPWERPPTLHAVQALVDLGWGHEEVGSGSVRDVLDAGRAIYEERMTAKVLHLLRRWERSGWVADTAV